jgi:iron complex transport system substrate-binding protein
MHPWLETSIVAVLVSAAAGYLVWVLSPKVVRIWLATRLAIFPPTAAPARRALARWQAAQGCSACSGNAAAAAPKPARTAFRILPVVLVSLVCTGLIGAAAAVVQAAAPISPSARAVLLDDTGAKVTLAGPARRIVSLSAGATELLFAAGAGDRIVATVTGADEPAAARRIERIGDANAIVYPRLQALKPDVVVVWDDLIAEGIVESLVKLRIPIYRVSVRELADLPRTVRRLGALAGTGNAADTAARALEAKVERLPPKPAAQIAAGARPPLRAFFMKWAEPLYTVGSRHVMSDALARCGARSIFDDIDFPVPIVEFKEIRKRDPEVILMAAPPVTARDWRERWAGFPDVDAVAKRQMLAYTDPRLDRMGPTALDAVADLCKQIAGVPR